MSWPVSACSIPVFRYALDRWPADNFRLEVSANDAKTDAVSRFLRNLGAASALNLEIIRLPADASGSSRLLRPHAEETATPPVWSGTLDSAALTAITNSPARREIVRRLLNGDSAVWVLVESGNRDADEAAARTLEKRLRYLEQVAHLPAIDPTDPSGQLGPGPKLEVRFSVLRVGGPGSAPAPTSPQVEARVEPRPPIAESLFRTMLAGPKSGLAASREPWLAAVFGRGRVLGAWSANGFGDEQIEEVSLFLLGACSCQVKKLNPGWDLVLQVDWDEELRRVAIEGSFTSVEQTQERANTPSPAPETVTISASAPNAPSPGTAPSLTKSWLPPLKQSWLLVAVGMLTLAAFALLVFRR